MPPKTSQQPDRYLVHHQGHVQGPFGVDFIEAMVMSGVYPSSVIVQIDGTSEQLPFSNLVAAVDSRPRLHAMNAPLQVMVDDFNRDVDTYNSELERVGTPIN